MKKILIADDDEFIRDMLKNMLAKDGFELITAKDGEEAFEKTVSHRPDLVICDIMMPKFHGFSVCQKIKNHEALRETKVMICTVKAYPADVRQAQQAGADAFLTKPLDHATVRQKIETLLGPL